MAKQERRSGESIDQMLRRFKRGVKDEGVLDSVRSRERFEKPSEKKKREFKAAQQRTRQQQQRDSLS